GSAVDPGTRFGGSSGGAITALSAYAISSNEYSGILHTSSQKETPFLNETVYSKTLNDLQNTMGSRYSPASPCEGLDLVTAEEGKSVFIGKPCDVAAIYKHRQTNVILDEKIGITIGFFCAGTPSTKATKNLMKKVGVSKLANVVALKYRGQGWPGNWQVTYSDDNSEVSEASLSYADSWGYLQKYRQWRCYICPDHTGEFADISVGDPWYKETSTEELGKSLIIARTERGQKFILDAVKAGYIQLDTMDNSLLPRSQPNLLNARGALWGRLLILRLFGAGVPNFIGFETFDFWMSELTLKEKAQSIYGTAKRVFTKRLTKRMPIQNGQKAKSNQK
ncbi:MAG: Coenzyme F420 hydrogenase/dehydrogenase, beta subunit C-terminal domain, partial [Oceanospirillaceae bacterium]